MTTTTTTTLTADEARALTDGIATSIREKPDSPRHISEAIKGKAHLALGYSSIAAWALKEFGVSRSRAYQILKWKQCEDALIASCYLSPGWSVREGTLRPLTGDAFWNLQRDAERACARVKTREGRDEAVRIVIANAGARLLESKKTAAGTVATTPLHVLAHDAAAKIPGITDGLEPAALLARLKEAHAVIGAMLTMCEATASPVVA